MLPDRPEPDASQADEAPELDSALAQAHKAVLEREERRVAERRLGIDRRRDQRPLAEPVWLATASVAWLLVFLVVLSPPAFLSPPAPAPYQPPEGMAESSLRYGLWLADVRVRQFLGREGRLPSYLGEAGPSDDAISMEVTGERSYRLVGISGELRLELSDAMSADSFLGSSVTMLRGD